ncbi:MAG: hypothetical protein LBV40_02875 [Methanomicrobiales archaeon]|jgi:hypothetical protein|nr:hypothetical protein [Methanomicrobiales archaeon]
MGNYVIREKIRILLIISIMLALCSCASAYYLYLDSPTNLRLGEEIYVEGSTNTPPPDVIHIVLSHVSTAPVEVARFSVPIEERGDFTFNATFDTSELEAGRYRIEGIADSRRNFSGDSRILRVLTLEDRTNEITLVGQREQWVSDVLKVAGSIRDFKDSSVSFELKKEGETVFGPTQVPVTYGKFDYNIPISEPGTYMLSISDYRGLVGVYQYILNTEDTVGTPSQNEIVRPTAVPIQTEETQTEEIQTEQTQTQEPVVDTVVQTTDPTTIPTTEITAESTTAEGDEIALPIDGGAFSFEYNDRLSRTEAGFYTIEPSADVIVITTTAGVDWVIEYIDPMTQSKHRVNDEVVDKPESVQITTGGSPVHVKIYPYSFNEVADITLFGAGISSLSVDNSARIAFGAPPSSDLEERVAYVASTNSSKSGEDTSFSLLSFLFG